MIEGMKEVVRFIWRIYLSMTHFGVAFAEMAFLIVTRIASKLAMFL